MLISDPQGRSPRSNEHPNSRVTSPSPTHNQLGHPHIFLPQTWERYTHRWVCPCHQQGVTGLQTAHFWGTWAQESGLSGTPTPALHREPGLCIGGSPEWVTSAPEKTIRGSGP